MKPRKYRLRIRLHRKIYDLLEMEALWQDSKIGTLANRILQEELAKLRQVGLDHCVCGDEDAASARRIEAEKHPESQGQTVKSYRYQIVGLLLHNPLLQELQKQ